MNRIRLIFICLLTASATAVAKENIEYEATAIVNAGSGDFAPYYMASNRHGILTQPVGGLLDVKAIRPFTEGKTFTWGYGVEVVGNASTSTDYLRYDTDQKALQPHSVSASGVWLQQLYGELKLHGCLITAGLKAYDSFMLNQRLSSGDFVESGNSRPIPELRMGFVDFQNIPLTKGWVQIAGVFSYGKTTDNHWLTDHYNYFDYHLAQDVYYTYKRIHFRTKPSERFSVTIGGQCAGQFGGSTKWYSYGSLVREETRGHSLKDMFEMFFPKAGTESFVIGNHLGSWDLLARYRLRDNSEIKAYFEWPWEDGSGIGKMNGFDGIWGLEYKSARRAVINGAVIEYIDFTNQSGPIHWAPGDSPGTDLTSEATGGDDYYESMHYNGYTHYGMSIGTPFIPSTLYNLDGHLNCDNSRIRGFHVGVEGSITPALDYRVLFSHRKGFGTARTPIITPKEDTSAMVEANYNVEKVKGLAIRAQVAFDKGKIYGNNIGGLISVSYKGNLSLGK